MYLATSSLPWRWLGIGALTVGSVLLSASAAESDPVTSLDPLDPLVQRASHSSRVAASMLIAAVKAGERLVLAGESGIILTSTDAGQSWKQADVPVSVTITGLSFPSSRSGWAVGHSGVILATTDGGQTWVRQLDGRQLAKMLDQEGGAPQPVVAGDPFLDVHFVDEKNGFAVGAFGLIVRTQDGGRTWLPWRSHLPNPDGNHLYGVRSVGSDLYIVGERGAIYASNDGGNRFVAVKAPYEGSLFGLTATADQGLLVYGLRGHAFVSKDKAQSWKQIDLGTGSAWLGATVLPGGRVIMVGQAGEVAQSVDDGASFTLLPNRQPPLTAVAAVSSEVAMAVGVRGPQRIELPALKRGG
jgi:photosystem II stability/assembly factor-like uncharacterized protein